MNRLVRALNWFFVLQLRVVLKLRWVALAGFAAVVCYTGVVAANMGREFMPELEEGNLWIRATYPLNESLETTVQNSTQARAIMARYPEVETVVVEMGRPDDGTDPGGFYNHEFFVPLISRREWPRAVEETSWRKWVDGDIKAPVNELRLIGPNGGGTAPADRGRSAVTQA